MRFKKKVKVINLKKKEIEISKKFRRNEI